MIVCDHASTAWCNCFPRPDPVYVRPHVELRGHGERLPTWECQCRRPDGQRLLRKYRHTEPWACLLPGDVARFWNRHPEIKTEDNARRLYWLWLNFETPRALCTACQTSTHRDELIGGQCPRCVEQARG